MTDRAGTVADVQWRADGAVHLLVDRIHRTGVLVIDQDCDLAVTGAVHRLLREAIDAGVSSLEIDLRTVSFADATAIRLALDARRRLGRHGGEITIKASPAVRRIFDLTHTSGLFEFATCP